MVRKIEACGVEKDTMINNLIIRQETEEDYKKTELVIMRSFWNKYWTGCTEHLLTRIIRDSQEYIPEISRIAEIDWSAGERARLRRTLQTCAAHPE